MPKLRDTRYSILSIENLHILYKAASCLYRKKNFKLTAEKRRRKRKRER